MDQAKALAQLFGVIVAEHEGGGWALYAPLGQALQFSAATLFEACKILECKPEELYWNPDLDHTGCYYDGDIPETVIVLAVRRV